MRPLWLLFTGLLLAVPLHAQQDSGASLEIRFAEGSGVFHVGEVIPIELSFRALAPDTYDMSTRNYDRSGRLSIEQFHVTPPGRDPLKNFYGGGAILGGGLGGTRALTDEPQVMRADLNEWVALDTAGHYSLYVTSGRITRRGTGKNEPVALQSNVLEFDIVAADPAWQQRTLSSAVTTLRMTSSTEAEKTVALRTLRFLDTPESAQELVRLLGVPSESSRWDEMAGLSGSSYQSLVVRELEQQMKSPDTALTPEYLGVLTKLKFQLDHDPLPPYPEKDTAEQKIWTDRMQARNNDLNKLDDAIYEQAAARVLSKSGAARTETVRTLLLRPTRGPGEVAPLAGLPPEEVAAAFLALSPDRQWGILQSFWERVRIPAMVAPLKKVAEQPAITNQMLRDLALRRLYDLDPAEAAPIFLEEMRHPHLDNGMFTVKGETLGLLPNETLPEFDEMLAARLEQKGSRTRGLDAQLIGRYSTPAILAKVRGVYETAGAHWDCVTEDGFVLYFLRVDPDYGVKRLAVAPSFCMVNSLPAVIRMRRWNEVEPGIIAQLNGPDLNRARQAAETLAKYGSPRAEAAMWERLRGFHAQWAERGNELVYRPGMQRDASEAMSFQFGLVEALGKAQAWLLTNEEVTALENLTVGQEADNVKMWHWSSVVNLVVNIAASGLQATINQYSAMDLASLRSKLAQYPGGTRVWLNIHGPDDRAASVLSAIEEVAAERGFQVDRPTPAH